MTGTDNRLDAALLSFVAAFVDTACFIGLFGLFTAHVTGNFVLIGAVLVSREGDLAAKLLALPVFIAAVAATAEFARLRHRGGGSVVAAVLATEAVLLLAVAIVAVAAGPQRDAGSGWGLVSGMLAVTAMALQNALMRIELAALPPTTVMTGNVTQAVIDALAVRAARSGPAADSGATVEARQRLRRMVLPIIAFALGAAAAAAGFAMLGLACLLLPAALALWLARRRRPLRVATGLIDE